MEDNGTGHYRWFVVGFSFIALALAYGATYYSFSIFFTVLLKEFGCNRSLTAGAFSVFLIFHGITGPLTGRMVDRFGPRGIFLSGSVVLGAGLALCGMVQRWWEFYIFLSVLTAVGAGSVGFVPSATMVQEWFREKRGLAMGILSAGIGFGIFTCVPAIQYLIDRVGWRMTYRPMAVFIPLAIFFMVVAFLGRVPRTHGSHDAKREETPAMITSPLVADEEWASRSWTLRRAANTRQFWLLWSSMFLSNFTIHSILAHQVAFFVDQGVSALFASTIVGMIGIVSIAGKIVWGGVSDRIGREVTYLAGVACSVCGTLLLILFTFFPNPYIPYSYAVFYGMGYAAVTALSPIISADFFEGRAYGSIFGALFMSVSLGGAAGAWFTGFLFDQFKSYVPVFVILVPCTLWAFVNIWIAVPRKIRRVPDRKSVV